MGRVRRNKNVGLRRRWLINTAGVVFILGLVCVLAITATFAGYYYTNMESDMHTRAAGTTEFFADYINQNYEDFKDDILGSEFNKVLASYKESLEFSLNDYGKSINILEIE